MAARGVAFDRAPVVGVDQRPVRDSRGSAAARRWGGPFKPPEKASFLGTIGYPLREHFCTAFSAFVELSESFLRAFFNVRRLLRAFESFLRAFESFLRAFWEALVERFVGNFVQLLARAYGSGFGTHVSFSGAPHNTRPSATGRAAWRRGGSPSTGHRWWVSTSDP